MKMKLLLCLLAILIIGVLIIVSQGNIKEDLEEIVSKSDVVLINGKVLSLADKSKLLELIENGEMVKNNEITETTPEYIVNIEGRKSKDTVWIYWNEYIGRDSYSSKIVRMDTQKVKVFLDSLFDVKKCD